jgi:dTDP-4-amino-4,6-dideoxygalactose transaminase
MNKIQMVDLNGQYLKIKTEVDSAIAEVIENSSFIKGPSVKSFEKNLAEYLSVKHVISCGNGTDALQLALMALGLKEGDEVITTNFTFAATVEVIGLLKLTPVLIDVNSNDFNMDIAALEQAISSKTKAIIPVHLFGSCANMEAILKIAKAKGLKIVEDNAQALGADYRFSSGEIFKSGTIGDIGTTSFFPSKNLGAYGDGGALYTNDDLLAKKIRSLANHGMETRYYYDKIGINSRLDSIQAAILDVKLTYLDNYAKSRRQAATHYNEALASCEFVITPIFDDQKDFNSHVFHQYTIRVTNGKRDALKSYLAEEDVPTAIYYPLGLDKQKAYSDIIGNSMSCPVSEKLTKEVLSLPMHTELSKDQLDYISKKILEFFKK